MKYVCDACSWVYDEVDGAKEHGVAPNTKWNNMPDNFTCPLCSVDKGHFSEEQ